MATVHEQLILHEGLKTAIYRCPAGKWTIGVGRNLEAKGLAEHEQLQILEENGLSKEKVIEKLRRRGVTREEALFLLHNDVAEITGAFSRHYGWFDALDCVRQKVLIDMAFNLGLGGLAKFKKMLKAIEEGDYQKAAAEMENSRWYRQVGIRSERLARMMKTGQDY